MSRSVQYPPSGEVDELLRNAELREEIEPFEDESVSCLNLRRMPTPKENEYLASMLAWERAAALPIAQWFDPPLQPPPPDALSDAQLGNVLWDTIHKLYEKRIVLKFTDHLNDRELYRIILRDILPAWEKKVELPGRYLQFRCADADVDAEVWLRHYASEDERNGWSEETLAPPPPREQPPYRRQLPG